MTSGALDRYNSAARSALARSGVNLWSSMPSLADDGEQLAKDGTHLAARALKQAVMVRIAFNPCTSAACE